jgi:hypothetical protein
MGKNRTATVVNDNRVPVIALDGLATFDQSPRLECATEPVEIRYGNLDPSTVGAIATAVVT